MSYIEVNMKYDYLVVGSGLFGSICAFELQKRGYSVLVVEKRNHIGGNVFTKKIENINVHVYGAHIFHTSNKEVWNYMNSFAHFNNFINCPIADYNGEKYNLPFNMNTFCQIWKDVQTPEQAMKKIEDEKKLFCVSNPQNLEEQAIKLVGVTIYKKLIKEYTEKQWGTDCRNLPPFIIKRLPVRFEYNNNYFNDIYQGIPIGGYTQIINKMLENVKVLLNTDFIGNKKKLSKIAKKIIYTGSIDEYFDYEFGALEYRTVNFVIKTLDTPNYQNNAVVNYTSHNKPYTRIIEHKHFEFGKQNKTVISEEYSTKWKPGLERFYPINNEENNERYNKYLEKSKKIKDVYFVGRLGYYKYMDMDKVVESALDFINGLTK